MAKNNRKVISYMDKHNVSIKEIARAFGVSETVLSSKLKTELNIYEQMNLIRYIDEIFFAKKELERRNIDGKISRQYK